MIVAKLHSDRKGNKNNKWRLKFNMLANNSRIVIVNNNNNNCKLRRRGEPLDPVTR